MDRYEEALERAKAGKPMDEVFPELKESEDERIRKWIYNLVDRMSFEGDNEPFRKSVLVWLEKQKEQQPAEGTALQKAFISSKINFTLEEKCDASDYAEVILPTSVAYGEDDEEYKLHKIIEAAFIAGQKKEQKPADIDYINGIREELLGIENSAAHIEGLTESQWVAIRAAHRLLGEYLEQEQKPAEWSEEDEKKIHFLSRLIEFQVKNDEYCFSEGRFVSKKEAIKMLKSLRPSWKPSEEQMEALKNSAYGTYQNGDGPALRELYEQLKKL